jgi:hypothetical protein
MIGIKSVSSILETHSLYTCLVYSGVTHDTLLTWICDKLLTHVNILHSCQTPLNISNSSLVLLLVLEDHWILTHTQCNH